MRSSFFLTLLISGSLLFSGCQDNISLNNNQPSANQGDWAVPVNQVLNGGPGKDGIRSIDAPTFVNLNQVQGLIQDNELVNIIAFDEVVRAYPHKILDWHEIINDEFPSGESIAMTYCPLTGTALVWDRVVDGKKTTFGVSGLLYQSNLIPYDRNTDSNYSQMLSKGINGSQINQLPKRYQMIETSFGTLKTLFPNATIVSFNTGLRNNYANYPYGDFRTNHNNLIFSVLNDDRRLPRKQRVLLIDELDDPLAFNFFDAEGNEGVKEIISDNNAKYYSYFNKSQNLSVAFKDQLIDGTKVELSFQREGQFKIQDSNGNKYDVLGRVQVGPNAGDPTKNLGRPRQFMGYWFAVGAFFPEVKLEK